VASRESIASDAAASKDLNAPARARALDESPDVRERIASLALGGIVVVGLFLAKEESYLLFHSLAEIFTVVIGCGIFMIAWNGRRFFDNNYLLFIGISFPFVALVHLCHTLAYRGMNVFMLDGASQAASEAYQANLATQLWIAGRYLQAFSFLLAPLFLRRRMKAGLVMGAYVLVTALVLATIFHWKVFPACFVGGGDNPSGALTNFSGR